MADTPIPQDWKSFLSVDDNKQGLFLFLAPVLLSLLVVPANKQFFVTQGSEVFSIPPDLPKSRNSLCSAEEADPRLFLHCREAYTWGLRNFLIYGSDTDNVVLAIDFAAEFPDCKIWVCFGAGRTRRYISAHGIAQKMTLAGHHKDCHFFMPLQAVIQFSASTA